MFERLIHRWKIGASHTIKAEQLQMSQVDALTQQQRVRTGLAENLAQHLTEAHHLFTTDQNNETGDVEHKLDLIVIPVDKFKVVITEAIAEAANLESRSGIAEETPHANDADCERIWQALMTSKVTSGSEAMNIVMRMYIPDLSYSRGGVAHVIKKIKNHQW